MTLNHSKSIKTVVSLLCMSCQKGNAQLGCNSFNSDLMSCTIPAACFRTFFQSTMVPENS